ncbi:MAG: hypothetical protein WKF57_15505 [Nakamurella sp.]
MKSLRSFGLGVLLTATMAFGGVALASSGGPASPNADPSGDGPAVVAPSAVTPVSKQQMLYSPVAPCRIVDTRNTTPLASGSTRSFYVAGTFGFAPQGGKTGGCGVPLGATSVSVSVTAIDPSNPGFLQAWPSDNVNAKVTVLNYGTQGITSGATIGLALGAAAQLKVKNSGGPTDLAIDVTGYYRPQIHAVLNSTGGIYSGSPRVLSSTNLATGSYRVQLDIDPTDCTPIASIFGSAYFASAYVSGGYIYANTYAPGGALTNLYWTLDVMC